MNFMNYKKFVFPFWGVLDVVYFLWILVASIMATKVPFYTDILASYDVAQSFENNSPIYIAWASAIISLSILVSGILMMLRKKLGMILSFIQFPMRIVFVIPSLFFLLWVFSGISTWLVYFLIIVTEVVKLFTLWKVQSLESESMPVS